MGDIDSEEQKGKKIKEKWLLAKELVTTKSINLHWGIPKEKREKRRENIRSDDLKLSKSNKTHEYEHAGSSTKSK